MPWTIVIYYNIHASSLGCGCWGPNHRIWKLASSQFQDGHHFSVFCPGISLLSSKVLAQLSDLMQVTFVSVQCSSLVPLHGGSSTDELWKYTSAPSSFKGTKRPFMIPRGASAFSILWWRLPQLSSRPEPWCHRPLFVAMHQIIILFWWTANWDVVFPNETRCHHGRRHVFPHLPFNQYLEFLI